MPQDRQKRKDPTEANRCQSLERTGTSNLEREASSTSSKSQKGHVETQDLSGPTSAGMNTKTASSATEPIPRRAGSVSKSHPLTAIRSK